MTILKLRYLVLGICILALLGCERTQVRIDRERTYRPQPTEPIPSKPPRVETPREGLSPAEPTLAKPYAETVSQWKSYQDLVIWMEKDFSLDLERFKRYEGRFPPSRAPEETFRLRSGIYMDVAVLAKETLNRINPSYKARIVVIIIRPYGYNHYVCSFREAGKIWILDYGTPYREVTGLLGPYDSLQEYRLFYEKNHPLKRRIEAVTYLGN